MSKPKIFREGEYTLENITSFRNSVNLWKEEDIYDYQLAELFEVLNPSLISNLDFKKKQKEFIKEKAEVSKFPRGNWIYYPWNGFFIHTVNQKDYDVLRTNRNKNLITEEEQKKLKNAILCFAGLSVGSHIASNCVSNFATKTIKIADSDILDTSNLNRIRTTLKQVSNSKIDILSQELYEMNPYLDIVSYPEGINLENLENFLTIPTPDIIFEVIDSFEIKIHLRVYAKRLKIPVIMMANLGDSVLLDIERYDLDSDLVMFNGVLGDMPEKILNNPDISDELKNKYAVEMVGLDNIPLRAIDSVREIGKSLVGRPQLMATVAVGAGILTYIARQIILGDESIRGRHLFKFKDIF